MVNTRPRWSCHCRPAPCGRQVFLGGLEEGGRNKNQGALVYYNSLHLDYRLMSGSFEQSWSTGYPPSPREYTDIIHVNGTSVPPPPPLSNLDLYFSKSILSHCPFSFHQKKKKNRGCFRFTAGSCPIAPYISPISSNERKLPCIKGCGKT